MARVSFIDKMFKKLVLVLGVVLVSWFALNYFAPIGSNDVSQDQAKRFALEDVKTINAEKRVVSIEKVGSEWNVELLLSFNAHSACPKLVKRTYQLLPIRFREESVITDCNVKRAISYPEEALITSSRLVSFAGEPQAYGCAFYSSNPDKEYSCNGLDVNALQDFSKGLPADSWTIVWMLANQKTFLALDSNANLLKRT